MKKILFVILTLVLVATLSAQTQKVRVSLFKKWYIGAFQEVTGKYAIAIDTVTTDRELYADEDDGFWSDADDQYSGVYDSLRLIIKSDTVFYDNEIFDNVYTVIVKPKYHYYFMSADNDSNRSLVIVMYPEGLDCW